MNIALNADIRCHWFSDRWVIVGEWHRLNPDERRRIEHQVLSAVSPETPLATQLSPWSYGMVLGELLSADLTRFGLFYLAPADLHASQEKLCQLALGLRKAFPLLDSQVGSTADGFELQVHRPVEESDVIDAGSFSDDDLFIEAMLNRPQSVFERGLMRFVRGQCAGQPRWGIWVHHLVADADFIATLLPHVATLAKGSAGTSCDPDFDFLQQQWRLERQLQERAPALEEYWRTRREDFSALSELPWPRTVSHCEALDVPDLPVNVQGGQGLLTRLGRSLALALQRNDVNGRLLALTPVNLRSRRGPAGAGCWINLVPLRLEACEPPEALEHQRLQAVEHSLLPAEAIALHAHVPYKSAQIMINVIDRPPQSAGFRQRPTIKSRLPLTLTLMRRGGGGWDGYLASHFGPARTQALAQAVNQELQRC